MPKGIVYLYRIYISLTSLSLPPPSNIFPHRISKPFSFPPVISNWASSLQTTRVRDTRLFRSGLSHTFNSAKSQLFQLSCIHTSILGFLLRIKLKNRRFPSSKMGNGTTSLCKRTQAPLFCPGYWNLLVKGGRLETLKIYPVNPVINLYVCS